MKANELRMGNFVEGEQGYVYPWELSDFYDCYNDHNSHEYVNSVKPILLTEEWLLKFGFEKVNRDVPAYEKENLIVEWLFERWTGRLYMDVYNSIQIIELKSVHQLQNLYFVLTGEELTISE
jgi:hypothetical protein